VYVDPIWVNNSNPLPSELADHNNTFLLGVGTRLRSARLCTWWRDHSAGGGYDPGVNHASFGFEKLIGGTSSS
jgi:hypothetical protein